MSAETRVCPRGGETLARTVDDNSGTLRFRCEEHDVEECGDCGAWVGYDDDLGGWYHLEPGTPGCFLHPESPIVRLVDVAPGDRVRRPHSDEVVTVATVGPRTPRARSYSTVTFVEGGSWTHHNEYRLTREDPR